ncbi:MAG: DUF423 domain-containing protein [Mesorhizobium sp.]
MGRLLQFAGSLIGAAGVATAAAAAHAGGGNLGTASTMLLVHAPAFLAVGLTAPATRRPVDLAAVLLLVGVVIFCGDLLARHYLGSRLFPYSAPIGGSLMIAGWIAVAITALARRN